MFKLADARINSLPSHAMQADFVPPSEEAAFILSASQLSALILQAIDKAIQPLVDRISSMESRITRLEEENVALRAKSVSIEQQQDTLSENQLIQLQLIHKMREETPMKAPAPHEAKPTKKTSTHIDEIALILANRERTLIHGNAPKPYLAKLRKEGMTFSQLASVLGLTVDRIRQLSRIAAKDQRFNVTWHPRRKNTKIIKLRIWDVQGF